MDKYGCYEAIHEIEKEIFRLVKNTDRNWLFRKVCICTNCFPIEDII